MRRAGIYKRVENHRGGWVLITSISTLPTIIRTCMAVSM